MTEYNSIAGGTGGSCRTGKSQPPVSDGGLGAPKRKSTRNKLLGAVHVAKKKHGMDDAMYRTFLHRVTGKLSAKDLTDAQLKLVLVHFDKIGISPPPNQEVKRKVTALWLSAYHLGVVSNKSEEAMRAFVYRQVKVQHENWMSPQVAHKTIEALKNMLERDGGVNWDEGSSHVNMDTKAQKFIKHKERHQIINAQLRKLEAQGKIQNWLFGDELCCRMLSIPSNPIANIPPEQQDELIRRLGAWIRQGH